MTRHKCLIAPQRGLANSSATPKPSSYPHLSFITRLSLRSSTRQRNLHAIEGGASKCHHLPPRCRVPALQLLEFLQQAYDDIGSYGKSVLLAEADTGAPAEGDISLRLFVSQ
jgi:hypothetical protein